MSAPPLKSYERNVTSQAGEDGVSARALELLGDEQRNGWCVEFGAFDGRLASNTYALITERGYSAVLIEADPERFTALQRTHGARPGVHALRRLVGFDGEDRLDRVLAAAPADLPRDFDLLSIDIDGNDYHVWEAVRDYRPKLVVVEYNPTIPDEVDFVQPRDLSVRQGSSLTALHRLGLAKGYRLIHATMVNAIFCDGPLFERFGVSDDSPAALRTDRSWVSWLFQTYDGRLQLAGNDRFVWHEVGIDRARLQQVPRPLRDFPEALSPRRHLAWRIWRGLHEPRAALARRWARRGAR